ncbi:MAG: FAD-dependent oxidoreductase [Woeseiaceae bacterium]|nr:FAD-dependent oxidoreductase [Woeseiaceae bacterium]
MKARDINCVTIVGAGQAGVQVAQSLRKRGFEGRIAMLGDEGYPPYQRPPLSKAFLKGEMAEARLFFKPESFYAGQDIELQEASAVRFVDPAAGTVTTEDGGLYSWDRLVLTTGSTPIAIPVPGAELEGVRALRGLADAIAIRELLTDGAKLVVVGGGYIGLEVASAARQLGHEVTVIERMPRLLSRVTSPPVSDFYRKLHRDHGVDVRLEESVTAITGDARVSGVTLGSGEQLAADIVLVGIGVRPNQALAEAAGIRCEDGILVDAHCRTSNLAIYAAGDCARTDLGDGQTLRLESVHNALDQAERIAADIVGDPAPGYDPPWFWSDQYDVKLQTVGLFNDFDEIAIRGDVAARKFSALYFTDGQLIAIDAINDPVSFMSGKQLFKKGIRISKDEALAAPTLKDLTKAQPNKETAA